MNRKTLFASDNANETEILELQVVPNSFLFYGSCYVRIFECYDTVMYVLVFV